MNFFVWTVLILILNSCDQLPESIQNEEQPDNSASAFVEDEPFKFYTWISAPRKYKNEFWEQKLELFRSAGIDEILVKASAEHIKQLMPLAQKYNLAVHAWIWTLNQPNNEHTKEHKDWYSVNRKGQNSLEYNPYVGYYQWLSPFHPDARAYIINNAKEFAQIEGLKSVHLDYVRYVDVILGDALQPKYNLDQNNEDPSFDFGYHPIARDSFRSIFEVDPLELKYPELSNEWRQFRLNAVSSLVSEIKQTVEAEGKLLSAAVFPFPEMSRKMVKQAWDDWPLDMAFPMLYHNFYNQNINWIGFCTQQCIADVNFPVIAGLYVPALKSAQKMKAAVDQAKENGAKGVCLFTFDLLNDSLKANFSNIVGDLKNSNE